MSVNPAVFSIQVWLMAAGSLDGQKQAVGTTLISLGLALTANSDILILRRHLTANSLYQGQRKRTMHESEAKSEIPA